MGIDRPHGGSDRPRIGDRPDFPAELRAPGGRDIMTPPTLAEIEHSNKVARGELRWRHDRWEESPPYDWARREDLRNRIANEVRLPRRVQDLPVAGDVLPRAYAEIDQRKFSDYSMNPGHPQNRGKAEGWRALGYDVDDPQARIEAADDLCQMSRILLPRGHIAATRDTPFGPTHKVLSGYIGPNGQHGTLVTCWMTAGEGDRARPRMTTAWMQPHRDKDGEQE